MTTHGSRLLTMLLALALGAATARAADAPAKDGAKEPIAWETSYDAVVKKAKASSKPMLFKFYTGWCPHCTRMDKTTWLDADVAKLATSFVAGKLNADVEKVPVSRYRLVGYPTVIVADGGGDEMVRMEGYKDAATVSRMLKTYLDSADAVKSALETLRARKDDASALLVLADFNRSVGLVSQAAERYMKAMKTSEGETLVRASKGAGECLVESGKAKQALKVLQDGLQAAGDAPPPSLMLAMGRAEAGVGNAAGAKSWFDKVLAAQPVGPEADAAKKELASP